MSAHKGFMLNSASRGFSGEMSQDGYFTDYTLGKGLLYFAAAMYVLLASLVAVSEPYISLPCEASKGYEPGNPAYNSDPCRQARYLVLLGLTPTECQFGRSLVMATLLGGIIGWERRQADRPAGIRTMSLVSLGSCLFTINSAFAFLNGPMAWDASRVSAAIPSGVGFLGAGLIFKKEEKSASGESSHIVTGLTTAASLWLSAAVGIACGGEQYFASSFGTAIMMLLLRFGPRSHDDKEDPDDDQNDDLEQLHRSSATDEQQTSQSYTETQPLNRSFRQSMRQSMRQRAALASTV